jgi:hypothetical protein
MTLEFNGESQSIDVEPSNNPAIELTAPDASGEYPVTLTYNGSEVCSATLTVLTDADFDEVTATGTYTGPLKIEFVNTKTCSVTASSSPWDTWIVDGTYEIITSNLIYISGTIKADIPSGESLKIGSCW